MICGRRRDDWLRSMGAAALMVKAFNGAELDLAELMPPELKPLRPPMPKLTEEQERAETRAALMLMGECLKAGL